jgi:hypothetical protein
MIGGGDAMPIPNITDYGIISNLLILYRYVLDFVQVHYFSHLHYFTYIIYISN